MGLLTDEGQITGLVLSEQQNGVEQFVVHLVFPGIFYIRKKQEMKLMLLLCLT